MSRIILSHVNLIDGAALSASSQAGDLAIQNVADSRMGKRWRCLGPADHGQADFRADVQIDVVALAFPRDTKLAAGTVRHCFDANGGTPGTGAVLDSTALDLGLADGYGYHVFRLPTAISARYWRWSYALTTPFADTGRAWAGEAWVPAVNFDHGSGDEWGDLSVVTQSQRSGAEFADLRSRPRGFTFALGFMDEDDRAIARELKRIAGISRQVLVIRDPDDSARETLIGRMRETSPIADTALNVFSTPFSVRESL